MPKGQFTPYTEAQKELIRTEYLTMSYKALARLTGSSLGRIKRFLASEGLEVPKEIIMQRQLDSKKKKGSPPPNKGKKQHEYMSAEAIERTKATRFQKGHLPHNTYTNKQGLIRIRKDAEGRFYKFYKVADGHWVNYGSYLWEQQHGPIPKQHIVVYKDGDSLNCAIENLELISKTENVFRNSKNNYPRELIPTMVALSKLNKKIKTIENKDG